MNDAALRHVKDASRKPSMKPKGSAPRFS
jgi:hypothetical protein